MSAAEVPPEDRKRSAIEIVMKAVNAALHAHIPVTTSRDPGVVLVSQHPPRWERDERMPGVNPLGAVLLEHQPEIGDLDHAIAHALGVSVFWALGFECGIEGQDEVDERLAKTPAAKLAHEGFKAGKAMRDLLERHNRVIGLL